MVSKLQQAIALVDRAKKRLDAAVEARNTAQAAVNNAERNLRETQLELKAERIKAERNAVERDRTRAKKLAALIGAEVEKEDDFWWVYPPEGLYDPEAEGDEPGADPYVGTRICTTWGEVLEHIETYHAAYTARKEA